MATLRSLLAPGRHAAVDDPGTLVRPTNPRQVKVMADFKGLRMRAPTRQTNKMLAALGATPVAMPLPQLPESISKDVIDDNSGAALARAMGRLRAAGAQARGRPRQHVLYDPGGRTRQLAEGHRHAARRVGEGRHGQWRGQQGVAANRDGPHPQV